MGRKKIFLDKNGNFKGAELQVEACKGAEGEFALKRIMGLMNDLKGAKEIDEVIAQAYATAGYVLCCSNFHFITKDSAKDLTDMIRSIADRKIQEREQSD